MSEFITFKIRFVSVKSGSECLDKKRSYDNVVFYMFLEKFVLIMLNLVSEKIVQLQYKSYETIFTFLHSIKFLASIKIVVDETSKIFYLNLFVSELSIIKFIIVFSLFL